ncbi:MAG: 16S rRNA (uracil(1498)-N(3))-methyltransferase [Proteobacteria bacterium]|nr:16S rRNA (uracil(1498)-N(3))-methyltransferase [Pseudomonadota bacterium]
MRLFYIEQSELAGTNPSIRGVDARHIINVLRLKPGDSIELFDESGIKYEARIVAVSSAKVDVNIVGQCNHVVESFLEIVVAQSFLKEGKMDNLIRQLTELGITKWIPFISERSVSRPDDKRLSNRTKRWEAIAKEATKQCKRAKSPKIGKTVSFKEILESEPGFDLKIIFWENEKNLLEIKDLGGKHGVINKILVMLGPEGGFTTNEVEKAKESGFLTAGLGPRILRAETASLSACTLIQFLFGDMGQKVLDKNASLK